MAQATMPSRPDQLTSILVVSNHLADDVSGAIELLRQSDIHVDHLGMGGREQIVRSDVLTSHDAIISIGKTVQYGLALGIPVYVHDHFGGEGWLSGRNFENELRYNFSGRATGVKKSSSEIAREIQDGFVAARRYVRAHQTDFQTRFAISAKVDSLLRQLPARAHRKKISSPDALAWKSFTNLYRGVYRTSEYYKDKDANHT